MAGRRLDWKSDAVMRRVRDGGGVNAPAAAAANVGVDMAAADDAPAMTVNPDVVRDLALPMSKLREDPSTLGVVAAPTPTVGRSSLGMTSLPVPSPPSCTLPLAILAFEPAQLAGAPPPPPPPPPQLCKPEGHKSSVNVD